MKHEENKYQISDISVRYPKASFWNTNLYNVVTDNVGYGKCRDLNYHKNAAMFVQNVKTQI